MTPHDRDRRRRTIAALLEARDALRAEREALVGRLPETRSELVAVTTAHQYVETMLERLAKESEEVGQQ